MISRRLVTAGLAGAVLAPGCQFYSDLPPVVIGGVPVSKDKPIMDALRASSDHARLVAALDASGLASDLAGPGPFTFFAPNDAAFEMMRPKSAKAQIESEPGILKQVLLGHIVEARLTTEDLLTAFPQLNGKTKVFARNKQVIRMTGDASAPRLLDLRKRLVNVVVSDAIASNGIIHVTDALLLPEAKVLGSP